MRAVKVFSLIFLVCAGLFLYPDGAGPASLIKIPKGAGLPGPFLSRLPVVVRQELETCLLALADGKSMALLRRNGVRFTILERNANKKEFVLVPIAAPGTLDSLRSRGKAVAVEPGTAVFWTESGRAAEAVPAGLPRKVLSSRPVRVDFKPIAAAGAPELRAAAADPLVEAIVALVSSSNLSSDVQSLQDFQTRYASTTNCEAAGEYLYSAFSALGLDVRFETFADVSNPEVSCISVPILHPTFTFITVCFSCTFLSFVPVQGCGPSSLFQGRPFLRWTGDRAGH